MSADTDKASSHLPRFVEVAVDAPVIGSFTYAVPTHLAASARPGVRVLAQFGHRAIAGVILTQTETPPPETAKSVLAVLDDEPLVSSEMIELARWISNYYRAPIGEAVRAALPPGTRISAALEVSLTDAGRAWLASPGSEFTAKHLQLLSLLATQEVPLRRDECLSRSQVKPKVLAQLAEWGAIKIGAVAAKSRVGDRTERIARLLAPITDKLSANYSRAPAKRQILLALGRLGGEATVAALKSVHPRAATHLRALEKDHVVEIEQRVVRRIAKVGGALAARAHSPHALNSAQTDAVEAIAARTRNHEFAGFLLHGITGSGKTEVYLQAISEVLSHGRSAIVLVPEISLTPQLAARFRQRFGDQVAVLHSGLSDRARFDEWHRLREGTASIALGARSAVFAPIANLGIIVVDEEHDGSFKQDEGVRYHGRNVALVRAKRANAVCVLGSATPSLESSHGASSGRLIRLNLPHRATAGVLPTVELVDLRAFQADSDSMLTAPLKDAITDALAAGDQIILFLNRRGWSTFVVCVACGDALRCPNCDVSLTYHRAIGRMLCHYCGHAQSLPHRCPSCLVDGAISRRGLGTEKIADAIAEQFPQARVARLDRDVATGANIERELSRMARREVDILIGTQMVTKGHDFPAVTLVGVLCADTGLSLPDFRASEKTFQLLTQVAGRAGRGDKPGRVIIQSYRTDHIAVAAAQAHDYQRFYDSEIESRRELGYPPWGHLVAVRLDGKNGAAVSARARELASAIRARLPADSRLTLLGPTEAPLARLKGRVRWHFWLRAPTRGLLRAALAIIEEKMASRIHGVRVSVDIDPVSAL